MKEVTFQISRKGGTSIMVLGQRVSDMERKKKKRKMSLPLTPFLKSIPDRSMAMEERELRFGGKREKRCYLKTGNDY